MAQGRGEADHREALADREGEHLLHPDDAGNGGPAAARRRGPAARAAFGRARTRRRPARRRCPARRRSPRAPRPRRPPAGAARAAPRPWPRACRASSCRARASVGVGSLSDRRLRRIGDRLAIGRAVREVEGVAEASGASAPRRRAPTPPRSRRRSRARRRPTYSFARSKTESSQAPNLEKLARVAGELAVDAVGDERQVEQHRARDVAGALAGREGGGRQRARCRGRPP